MSTQQNPTQQCEIVSSKHTIKYMDLATILQQVPKLRVANLRT